MRSSSPGCLPTYVNGTLLLSTALADTEGRGSPWGINFRSAKHFGQDCGWYPGLKELIEDWGIGE